MPADSYCLSDRRSQGTNMVVVQRCQNGHQVEAGAKFCAECGVAIPEARQAQSEGPADSTGRSAKSIEKQPRKEGMGLRRRFLSRGSPYAAWTFLFILAPILVVGVVAFIWTVRATDTADGFDIALGYVSPLKDKAGPEGALLGVIAFLFIPAAMGGLVSVVFDYFKKFTTGPELQAIQSAEGRRPRLALREQPAARRNLIGLLSASRPRLIPTLFDLEGKGDSDDKAFAEGLIRASSGSGIDVDRARRNAEKVWLDSVGSLLATPEVSGDMDRAMNAAEQLLSERFAQRE